MDLKNVLITTVACLAIDCQKRIGELEKKYSVGRADCFMPSEVKKEYEGLIAEFDTLKVRAKAIQNEEIGIKC